MRQHLNPLELHESNDLEGSNSLPASADSVAGSVPEENAFQHGVIPCRAVLTLLLSEITEIDFCEKAGLPSGALTRQQYLIISIEEIIEIAKRMNWSLCMADGQLYVYNGAFWHSVIKSDLLHFLGEAAERLGVKSHEARYYLFKSELLKQFMSSAYFSMPVKTQGEVLINFQNGTFSITPEKQWLREFDHHDFLCYQLPFAYDPGADAPLFQEFLNKVLPDPKQQEILAEFIAYIFIPQKTLKLEKALILYGSGANGKSTFYEIIMELLGPANVSSFSLQSLTNESGYYRAKLATKLLNYASEISPKMDSTIFKQLVSGEPVEARLPYGEPFSVEDYARFIFNCNELPKDTEQNLGFFRRFLILRFGVTISEEEKDPELASKIIAEELPGVFNWAMAGMSRLLAQKRFTQSDAVDQLLTDYRQQSDSVQLFLAEENYPADPACETPLKDLYSFYRQYCTDCGYRACAMRVFSDRLRTLRYEVHRKKQGNVVSTCKKSFI